MRLLLILGILLIMDAGVGLQGWRKYLLSRHTETYIPRDILLEIFAGFLLCCMYLWTRIDFKNIDGSRSHNVKTWENSAARNNFRTFTSKRAYLINEFEDAKFHDMIGAFIRKR